MNQLSKISYCDLKELYKDLIYWVDYFEGDRDSKPDFFTKETMDSYKNYKENYQIIKKEIERRLTQNYVP